jgi:hypothetical protein
MQDLYDNAPKRNKKNANRDTAGLGAKLRRVPQRRAHVYPRT